jgi:Ion transport protein
MKIDVNDRIKKNIVLTAMFKFVESTYFKTFILFTVLANILFLGIDGVSTSNSNIDVELASEFCNYVFVIIYLGELALKICLFGIRNHLKSSPFVIFDCLIVAISLCDIAVEGVLIGHDIDML